MELYSFETVLTFGQHKGETISHILKNNPTYIEWCYGNHDDFYITDAVWNALDVHKNLEHALKNGGIDPIEVKKAMGKNKKLHEEKRNTYKTHMMESYELSVENDLKGSAKDVE
ncbi:hypothetical protein HCG49_18005 [Arenibacter sp. 6A1]|uniref:exodeoxyribonuclease X C-terminal domain-containing protein n=1 Tax=Arenibacter sp. 6A1 TaxID=2720391 RepID=UPI001447B8BF|nr:hypothetical protein [Arenibacter sp. 6A1]NKI28448.1 hypothetical protein [Arenibacter sp. 6A1]